MNLLLLRSESISILYCLQYEKPNMLAWYSNSSYFPSSFSDTTLCVLLHFAIPASIPLCLIPAVFSLSAHDIPSLSHNWKSHVYFMSYWTSHVFSNILSSFLLLWVSSEMEYLESLPGFEHLAALLSCVPHSMCFQHVLIHKVGFIITVFFNCIAET